MDLGKALEELSLEEHVDALYHTAAVSDFYLPFPVRGKIPTENGALTLTLEPTPKLLPLMHGWFPNARITGWKFEASGDRSTAVAAASTQILKCSSEACVLNGPAYGDGFGYLLKDGTIRHFSRRHELCDFLAETLNGGHPPST
jgi:phosphopantothenoylcysteine decarboxylase/phosphopantothenate--cysteine ligase